MSPLSPVSTHKSLTLDKVIPYCINSLQSNRLFVCCRSSVIHPIDCFAVDALIVSNEMERVAIIDIASDIMEPFIQCNAYTGTIPPTINTACELFYSKELNISVLQIRSNQIHNKSEFMKSLFSDVSMGKDTNCEGFKVVLIGCSSDHLVSSIAASRFTAVELNRNNNNTNTILESVSRSGLISGIGPSMGPCQILIAYVPVNGMDPETLVSMTEQYYNYIVNTASTSWKPQPFKIPPSLVSIMKMHNAYNLSREDQSKVMC